LRRVAAIEFQPRLDCYKALCDAVDPDNEVSEMELKRYLLGTRTPSSQANISRRSSKGHDNFSWKRRPRSNCAAGTCVPPNFGLLDATYAGTTPTARGSDHARLNGDTRPQKAFSFQCVPEAPNGDTSREKTQINQQNTQFSASCARAAARAPRAAMPPHR